MSLLTICQGLAENVGLERPTAVITSPDREWAEAVAMSNLVGEELARRVDFDILRGSAVVTGDGTDRSYDLPAPASRLIPGVAVVYEGVPVRPLTAAEWSSLTPVAGRPRYFLFGKKALAREVSFWPYLASGAEATVHYQSKAWCDNGTDAWVADTDTSLIDETLMLKGLIVRWRRQKGMAYQDYEAEYEMALQQYAQFDDRSRLS